MMKQKMILLIAIDEFHQGQIGHWDAFRPEMMTMIRRLRVFRAPGAPTVCMSATATTKEVSEIIASLSFQTPPVELIASPNQPNIKVVTIQRPPNNHGPDGFTDKKGVENPGFLALLERIYLREFVKYIREGKAVKRCIIFCRYYFKNQQS